MLVERVFDLYLEGIYNDAFYFNMSYGAIVGASAANSNLINFFKNHFTPVLNKSDVHCDFLKRFTDYLKNTYEFKLFVVVDIYSIYNMTLPSIVFPL